MVDKKSARGPRKITWGSTNAMIERVDTQKLFTHDDNRACRGCSYSCQVFHPFSKDKLRTIQISWVAGGVVRSSQVGDRMSDEANEEFWCETRNRRNRGTYP